MRKKRLLITGVSGFLGWNLSLVGREVFEIFGTVFSHPMSIDGVNTLTINLTDAGRLKELFEGLLPDAVIHTAAATQPNFCELNPSESFRVNVDVSLHVASLCADRGIPCVFTSTDLVFDGGRAPYGEDDPVDPVNTYGRQKVLAEVGMKKRCRNVLICRMPLMFGLPSPSSGSFIQPLIRDLRAGRAVKLFVDEFRTPISGRTAARALLTLIGKTEGQVLHLGGPERVSRYEFGLLLAGALRLDQSLLLACKQEDVPMAAPRPRDVSLDSTKARCLGFDPPSLEDELSALAGSL